MKGKRWNKWDWMAVAFVALLCLWTAIPSSVFIANIKETIVGREVTFYRETPFGSVRAEWFTEITLVENGFECSSREGAEETNGWRQADYQVTPTNTIRYTIGDWADECFERGGDFIYQTTRRVLVSLPLFGEVPLLRPSKSPPVLYEASKEAGV